MDQDQEYLEMMRDTSELVAKEKAQHLGEAVTAFNESTKLANDVEFWKWLGNNYPRNFSNTEMIQKTALEKSQWLNTQLQGKGYEWDYMATSRMKPSKVLSVFKAGDCPTQPGIDITETSLLDNSIKGTYQNKAYLSSNAPNLHNTPKEAIVVTNKEKVAYANKKGYLTEEYLDSKKICDIRDSRFQKAVSGKVDMAYTLKNVAAVSAKAGVVGAAIGITSETIGSYRKWKNGELTDKEYLQEIMKAGGEAGATAGLTSAAMIPVQAAITAAGASTLLTIPIAFAFGTVINSVIAPCFGRGKYKKILEEAKYYQALEGVYDDFLNVIEITSRHYERYVFEIQKQTQRYKKLKEIDIETDKALEELYQSI